MQTTLSKTPVIIAAMNEEQGIGPTVKELQEDLGNVPIIVVDGISTDQTTEIAKRLGALVIGRDGKGKGDAVRSAIAKLKDEAYQYVIFTDADYTYPARFIPQMLKIIAQNQSIGMVCGNRFSSNFQTDSMNDVFYYGNRLFILAQRFLNGIMMKDPLSGLRVVRWSILKNWIPKSKGFGIEVEMNQLVQSKGFRIQEIDILYRPRLGEKKLNVYHGFEIFASIITSAMVQYRL